MLVKDNVDKAAILFHDDDITRPDVMHTGDLNVSGVLLLKDHHTPRI
jgi:hypothetical protein